jgi:hypothetical protein
MCRTPRLVLAGIFMAGVGLTGCESCSLFGARKPLQQDPLAVTPTLPTTGAAPSAGWQGQPKAWTTSPIDPTVKPVAQGQTSSTFSPGLAGQTTNPAAGASNMNSLNSPVLGTNSMTSGQGGFSTSTPSAMTSPYGASTRTTNPPVSTPQPEWTPDPVAAQQRLVDPGKTSNFQNLGTAPATQGSNLTTPSLQAPSLSAPSSGANGSQYQTQYMNPGANAVKQMPPPGRGDE